MLKSSITCKSCIITYIHILGIRSITEKSYCHSISNQKTKNLRVRSGKSCHNSLNSGSRVALLNTKILKVIESPQKMVSKMNDSYNSTRTKSPQFIIENITINQSFRNVVKSTQFISPLEKSKKRVVKKRVYQQKKAHYAEGFEPRSKNVKILAVEICDSLINKNNRFLGKSKSKRQLNNSAGESRPLLKSTKDYKQYLRPKLSSSNFESCGAIEKQVNLSSETSRIQVRLNLLMSLERNLTLK